MKLRHTLLLALAGVSLSACTNSYESFAKNIARHYCTNYEECNKSLYEEAYNGDRGKCRDDVEKDLLEAGDEAEAAGCKYDKDAGSECYKAARKYKKECDPPDSAFEACGEVWDCPDGTMYSEGITFEEHFESLPFTPPCSEIDLDALDPTVDVELVQSVEAIDEPVDEEAVVAEILDGE